MVSCPINHPTTTAYSICWYTNILAMYAHQPNNNVKIYESAAVASDLVDHAIWLYMPIDQGDTISEIWKRSGCFNRHLALLFITKRGRLYQLGPQHTGRWDFYTWTLLDQPSEEPALVWFDQSKFGIHELAFETPTPQPNSLDPTLVLPLSTFPESTSLRDYFYTSVLLNDVVNVALCVHPSAKRITGLLFHRNNGDQACVGQIRLDCLQPPVQISRSAGLWLGFVSTSLGVFVESAQLSRPRKTSSVQWFKVFFRGRLDWWFSVIQCKVYQDGRASPPTRM